MPCLRHRSLAGIPAACSFKTLMICSSVNLLLRIVRLLGGEQNPNSKSGAFQGSRSLRQTFQNAQKPVVSIISFYQEKVVFNAVHQTFDVERWNAPCNVTAA